jgi:N6-adenosine-specific RNA methylase IME4
MTRRTCALCGERDAATLTDYDGRPGWEVWGNQAPGQEAGAA